MKQQRRLLEKAGYSEREVQTILAGDGQLISIDKERELFSIYNRDPDSKFAKDIQSSRKRDEYIKQWMRVYNISERAATEFMYQIRQTIAMDSYLQRNMTRENGTLDPIEYSTWVEQNTL